MFTYRFTKRDDQDWIVDVEAEMLVIAEGVFMKLFQMESWELYDNYTIQRL